MSTKTSCATTNKVNAWTYQDLYGEPLNDGDWVALAGEAGQGGAGFRFGQVAGRGKTGNIKIKCYYCWRGPIAVEWHANKRDTQYDDPHRRCWKVSLETLPLSLRQHVLEQSEKTNAV